MMKDLQLKTRFSFFKTDEIISNSIKSVLTIHDSRRVVNGNNISNDSLAAQAVKGGFPCFEKNLPIENATNNRYILGYNRVGRAELVYNMKWSTQSIDKSYKTAYLSSLLLHVYAQLFIEGHEPYTLKWSYPSSMGKGLLSEYRAMWDSLKEISPIESDITLITYPPSDLSDIGDTEGSSWENAKSTSDWGTNDKADSSNSAWGLNDINSAWGATTVAPVSSGWGDDTTKKNKRTIDIATEFGPIRFDFKPLDNQESLTEACAVANYLVNSGYSVKPGELVLCFDIGGSTTDITALCQMDGGKAMIKQNSIRFAAQRVAQATKYSKKISNLFY
ncbi:MAG: hypothetical protein IPM91_05990 [Bacteroidetes bacterium]|nr:hypothetical protein [Bacteroidota bacterium]